MHLLCPISRNVFTGDYEAFVCVVVKPQPGFPFSIVVVSEDERKTRRENGARPSRLRSLRLGLRVEVEVAWCSSPSCKCNV